MLLAANNVGERLAKALLPDKIRIFDWLAVSPSLITAVGVTVLILSVCLILRLTVLKRLKNVPGPVQSVLEMAVGAFDKMARESTHEYAGFTGPYIMAAAVYIATGTLAELLGIRPALADINGCIALGLSTFFLINFFGFKKKKIKRLARFKNPINIITDIAVPISLSFRMFGSITSGLMLMELIYSFLATSFVLPAFVSVISTLFHAFIQAYIFATLSSLFVGEAME